MINVTPAVNSIKIALEEVNAKGIMINGVRHRFNVRWYDEECNPKVAVNAARAALDQVKPLHVVWAAMCSQTSVAIRPLLLDAKAVAGLLSISEATLFRMKSASRCSRA